MTVNTTTITSGPYTGNGITTEYDYTFRVDSKTEVAVYETANTEGATPVLLTVDVDYTVNGVGMDGGGTIERLAGALPTGGTWYIRSDYDETQLTAFGSQGGFFPDVHESAMDKLTFLIQQIKDSINRSFRLPDSYSGGASAELPTPEALKFVRWNSSADALENVSGTTSASTENSIDRKNFIRNGNFDVWKRGTSFTVNGYTADRWVADGSGTFSVTKHSSPNKVLVSMVSEGSFCNLLQAIEEADVFKLRGKEVTFSANMTTNATHSGQFNIGARYSNTTDFLVSQITSVISETKTVGVVTTRISVTFTVPADAVGLLLFIENSVVQAVGSLYDVSEVQLEKGSVVTDLEYRSIGEELFLCQRYFQIIRLGHYNYDGAAHTIGSSITYPTIMRISPTVSLRSGAAVTYQSVTNIGMIYYSAISGGSWNEGDHNLDAEL